MRRIMRVSCILIPGRRMRPDGIGRAMRWQSGKSTWTLSASASNAGQAVGHGGQLLAHGLQIIQGFLQSEVLQVVAQRFQPEEGGELLVHWVSALYEERFE